MPSAISYQLSAISYQLSVKKIVIKNQSC